MATFDYALDFDVKCEECGADLDTETKEFRGQKLLKITPCSNCMDAAKEKGKEECEAEHE